MNHVASASIGRLRSALQPQSATIKEFVLTKTFLRGKRFSLKDHEYQEKVLDLYSDPSVDLVVQKPAQFGISEVVYRAMNAWSNLIPGFSSAIVFPTAKMSNEVMATRVAQIIAESPELASAINPSVDSASVKMFRNGSIIYALGASAGTKSTVINRPIRAILVDEYARCDMKIIEGLQARQRHQIPRSSIKFSTPLLEDDDIDAEIKECKVVWEQILICSQCGHDFIPDFFQHVRVPGFDDDIRVLTMHKVERKGLDTNKSYLQCPKCGKPTTHFHTDMRWICSEPRPSRHKIGLKLSAFALPKYITPHNLVNNWLSYEDKAEFVQQDLGLPASKEHTAMDVTRIQFVGNDIGTLNVWALDLGKVCHFGAASISKDTMMIHSLKQIHLQDLDHELPKLLDAVRPLAGVIDFNPYNDIATRIVNEVPNTWSAIYDTPSTPTPELFRFNIKEDDSFGTVKHVKINKNLTMDAYVERVMMGQIVFKDCDFRAMIRTHHQGMRRVKDFKNGIGEHYVWIKPQRSKTVDHFFHVGVYLFAASRIMTKNATSSLPLTSFLSSFKMERDL